MLQSMKDVITGVERQ